MFETAILGIWRIDYLSFDDAKSCVLSLDKTQDFFFYIRDDLDFKINVKFNL